MDLREAVLAALTDNVELSASQIVLLLEDFPEIKVMQEVEKLLKEGFIKLVPGDFEEDEAIFALSE